MLQSVVRRFDPAGLGLAVAALLAAWAEPYASPGTASVETRLDVIIGLGLPLILILVAADSLWQRWRGSPCLLRGRGTVDTE
jgi:hypothetical protein